ncbi:MAG: hypothetical protein ACREGE_01025 [Candidatus Microsaccharimonas sp.]
MPPEFTTGFSESDIEKTCQATEQFLGIFSSPKEFLDTAIAEYASIPSDRAELIRMIRVAEFVTGPGDKATSDAIRAFFYGEVIASDLIRRLPSEQEGIGGYAHEYLKNRLEQSREGIHDDYEMPLDGLRRKNLEAASIREELINPTLPIPASLEAYIDTITAQLEDSVPERHFSTMGFHLVMQEFLHPNSHRTTQDTLQEVDAIMSESESYGDYIEAMEAAKEVARAKEPETYEGAPTVAETEALLGDNPDITDEPEMREKDYARKELLEMYLADKKAFAKVELKDDAGFQVATRHLWEKNLRDLAATEHLFTKKDLLVVNGDYFAITSNGETSSVSLFNSTDEIIGAFEGIHLVEAPTVKELKRALAAAADYTEDKEATSLTPVVRINDPTYIQYKEGGEQRVVYGTGLTIDIPIIYKTALISSVALPEYDYLGDDPDRA